jgi:hypothetical protein
MQIAMFAAALLLLLASNRCGLVKTTEDNFVCGVRKNPESTEATYCSGENEACICATHRCARVAPPAKDCASGWEYMFSPTGCVETGDVLSRLETNTNAAFCPDQAARPPPCGVSRDGGVACEQACLCGVKPGDDALQGPAQECVIRSSQCALGWMYAFDKVCVEGPQSATSLIVRKPEERFCPGEEPTRPRCGLPGMPGNAHCTAQQVCLCGPRTPGTVINVTLYSCLHLSSECPSDGGIRLADRDETCVNRDPQELTLLFPGQTACPGASIDDLRPDAGVDAGMDAGVDAGPPPRCGIPFDGGIPSCGGQAACLCKAKDGAPGSTAIPRNICVAADDLCRTGGGTGLAGPDGQCITGVSVSDLVLRFYGEGACPGYNIDDFRPDAGDGG